MSNNKSPISTRPSPNSRNSEIANPVRRSFTGNPFAKPSIVAHSRTPESTTTPRRSSMTAVTFSEDKENGKDSSWRQIRVKSPTTTPKHFMSPTISAVSKINSSPKKKILAERNEPVWTSEPKRVSFAPVVTLEVGPTSPAVLVSCCKPPKPLVGFECPEGVCENAPDCSVNLDPTFKISPPATATGRVIAPLDADPSAPTPPYDPKTNYLSPRPQFLHYRPNPRVEYYMGKDGEAKKSLEESFSSESFLDSEETQWLSECSPKQVEDVTSPAEEQVIEEEEEVPLSEPMLIISPSAVSMPKEEAAEGEESNRPWRSRFTALMMIFSVVLFAVLAVDVNVEVWSASSMSFVSEFISNIRGAKNVSPLQYYNLTLMENEYSVFEQCHKEMEEIGEFDVFGNVIGSVSDLKASDEKGLEEIGADESVEKIDLEAQVQDIECFEENLPEAGSNSMKEHVEQVEHIETSEEEAIGAAEYAEPIVHEAEILNIEYSEEDRPEVVDDSMEEHVEQVENIEASGPEVVDDSMEEHVEQVENIEASEVEMRHPAVGAAENHVEVHAVPEFQETAESKNAGEVPVEDGEVLPATQAITEVNMVSDHVQFKPESIVSSEVLNRTADGADSMVSMMNMLGFATLVFTLIGSTAIIYMNKRKNSQSNPANYAVQPLVSKELAASPVVPISTEHTYCSSEMSISSVHRSEGLRASDEVESQEKRARKNNRRDSVASIDSSMGSPSYGSFTTYERIPIKKGEEEIMTPVRRSSRIIRKVTSP